MVTIVAHRHLLVVDFERPEAQWALLVIDDRWRSVVHMVEELQERSLQPRVVQDYWALRRVGMPEPFIGSLLALVPLAFEQQSISRIAFAPFPPYLEPGAVTTVAEGGCTLAAMIDVLGESGPEDKHGRFLESSWSFLDETSICPAYARVLFTRGFEGADHEGRFVDVPELSKNLAGRPGEFEPAFKRWWSSLLGDIRTGATVFADVTRGQKTHEARSLLEADDASIRHVLSRMLPLDTFGVWAWCRDALPARDYELQRRWFAAKAFQYAPPTDSSVSVLSLLALLNGTAMSFLGGQHAVVERSRPVSSQDIRLALPACLGEFELSQGRYQDFVGAMRAWLLHPEQSVNGKSRAVQTTVGVTETAVELEIVYSAPLPESLIRPTPGQRIGSARGTLERLLEHCDTSEVAETLDILKLSFRRSQ